MRVNRVSDGLRAEHLRPDRQRVAHAFMPALELDRAQQRQSQHIVLRTGDKILRQAQIQNGEASLAIGQTGKTEIRIAINLLGPAGHVRQVCGTLIYIKLATGVSLVRDDTGWEANTQAVVPTFIFDG